MSDININRLVKRAHKLLPALARGEHLEGLSGPERQEFRNKYWLLRSLVYSSSTYDINKLEWETARAEVLCQDYGIDI